MEQAPERTTLPSRQQNDSNCGVYQIMFMLLLPNGKSLDLLADSIKIVHRNDNMDRGVT